MLNHRSRKAIKTVRRVWLWIAPFLKYLAFAGFAFAFLLAIPPLEAWLEEQSPFLKGALGKPENAAEAESPSSSTNLDESTLAGQIEGVSIVIAMILFFNESRKRSHYEAQQVIDAAKGGGKSYARIRALEDLAREAQSLRGLEVEPEADLQEINLSAADLRNAKLVGANLAKARLWEANLQEANLSKATLEGANCIGANLIDADLPEANLEMAKLRDANLQGADLSHANLQGADLRGANLQRVIFQGADLAGTQFANADLKGANFLHVTFVDVKEIRLAQNWEDPSTRYSAELLKLFELHK